MTWTGGEALFKNLDLLEKKLARQIMKAGVKEGAEVLLAEARANARQLVGADVANLINFKISSSGKFMASAKIGVPRGRHPAFKLRFFEFGTGGQRSPKEGLITRRTPHKRTGSQAILTPLGPRPAVETRGMRARPWLRPAMDTKMDQARHAMGVKLWEGIQEAA